MGKAIRWLAATSAIAALLAGGCGQSGSQNSGAAARPNILFVIMDDVGIDQMRLFGYGGSSPAKMPTIEKVAASGVRFRNTWSMPECSPGRIAMLAGRYPFRTNVYQAIGQNDLANAQLSPFETTAPKLLKQAGYRSGMFGKFHLAGPENNPAGNGTPRVAGWDYFYGWIGGLPASLDTTGGGIAATGTYPCGFVPAAARGGADQGACHQPGGSCSALRSDAGSADVAGKQCVAGGGVFVPNASCSDPKPAGLDFGRLNAYYVSPLVIDDGNSITEVAPTDARARGYRTRIETDAAIAWIRNQPSGKPWMATLSFSAPHTPMQQPPGALLATGTPSIDTLDCRSLQDQQSLQNRMIEALDTEVGRLMVETGIARRAADGSLDYDPMASNTMVVIVGDNGSLGSTVKSPFSPSRAKGTAYQTGVWTPLVVAGPLVAQPDREVAHMVNMVDVFRLFGEIAGIDVAAAVPRSIDAAPMMPYLSQPGQPSIRTFNFAMGGFNSQANEGRNGPCVIGGNSCSQIPVSKSVCEDNNGVWWGAGASDAGVPNRPTGYASCCQVNQALVKAGRPQVAINPEISIGLRDDRYKLVQNTTQFYDAGRDACTSVVTNELYEVDQATPTPRLDNADANLLAKPLTDTVQAAYTRLSAQLSALLASQPACPGDGNIDGVVDAQDTTGWLDVVRTWVLSSVFDFNLDGKTDSADSQTILRNQGNCPKAVASY